MGQRCAVHVHAAVYRGLLSQLSIQVSKYGGGLTRIAVRKYTSFGVHPAGKHLGNGLGILPNINYLSVYMGIQRFGYASVMLPSTSCWSVSMGGSR